MTGVAALPVRNRSSSFPEGLHGRTGCCVSAMGGSGGVEGVLVMFFSMRLLVWYLKPLHIRIIGLFAGVSFLHPYGLVIIFDFLGVRDSRIHIIIDHHGIS